MQYTRKNCEFLSHGKHCRGWMYLPVGAEKPPVVLMAHGLAAEKEFVLPAFAEQFAARGLAVFLFDYRHLGESEGAPRNLVSYRRQLQDFEAALAWLHTVPEIDADRIGLWGTSYSGGHVIKIAARHPEIKAVSAHVPFADGIANMKTMDLPLVFKLLGAGCRDLLHVLTGQEPYCVPVAGKPGSVAALTGPGALEGYMSMVPQDSSWENKMPARFALTFSYYRPTTAAARIQCPVLVIMGTHDQAVDPASIRKMAAKIPDCRFIELPMGHFDAYTGELFEKIVVVQGDFLAEKLLV